MKEKLTKTVVDKLTPRAARFEVWDTLLKGFGVRVGATGEKVFILKYRLAGARKVFTIGRYGDALTVEAARKKATGLRGDIVHGLDPMGERREERRAVEAVRSIPTVADVARDWVERVAKKHNKTWKEAERVVNVYVVPTIGAKAIKGDDRVRRADINALVDDMDGTPLMADRVLTTLTTIFNWYATRDEDFVSPVVKGMSRIKAKKHARTRVLTDDELRALWRALDATAPPFRQLIRFLLLSAQRRGEGALVRRPEIGHNNGVWTIPAERYKTGLENVVPLSDAALDQLAQMRKHRDDNRDPDDKRDTWNDYVFTTTGLTPFSGFSKSKARLDVQMEIALRDAMTDEQSRAMPEPALKPWVLHDLRRTAKTIMSRVGVRPDISERVIGHVIHGVEGVYDRHDYLPEKRDALEKLARELTRIIEGRAAKVIPLRPAKTDKH